MEQNNNDRRSEQRLTETVTVLLERHAADFDNSRPASILICRSLDISANGLQLRVDEPIPVGTILRLCAQFSSGRQSLCVVGEVKWMREENGAYSVGFALFESEGTDIVEWKHAIAGQLR
jgi:hypothetical protein